MTSEPGLANVANVLTVFRILLIPVFVACLLAGGTAWRLAALEAPQDSETPHPESGSISAFDVVQRNAHEVCHHLWDVQRGEPARQA